MIGVHTGIRLAVYKTNSPIFILACLGSVCGDIDSTQAARKEVVRFDFENGEPQGWDVVDGFFDPDAGTRGLIRKRQNPNEHLGQYSLATDAIERPHGE